MANPTSIGPLQDIGGGRWRYGPQSPVFSGPGAKLKASLYGLAMRRAKKRRRAKP